MAGVNSGGVSGWGGRGERSNLCEMGGGVVALVTCICQQPCNKLLDTASNNNYSE